MSTDATRVVASGENAAAYTKPPRSPTRDAGASGTPFDRSQSVIDASSDDTAMRVPVRSKETASIQLLCARTLFRYRGWVGSLMSQKCSAPLVSPATTSESASETSTAPSSRAVPGGGARLKSFGESGWEPSHSRSSRRREGSRRC